MEAVLSRFSQLSTRVINHSEILAAIFVLLIIFMMVMPLPTWLVDTLIAFNICAAILLVVFAMYLPGPLAFSTFPGVLLLTTLFRLALSITTTRLILLQADAGEIVQAFGDFVVGGNVVVGLVIFFILTVVQFLVITKGSERIAEVAARFSLDAMPGKQMSIDSDLRAGLIDADAARERRDALSRESQLYGAMDGAMKFVKGDAIAGLVIVAVNLIGGFTVGVLQHSMSFGEAVPVYSVLTVGDGLVAQIPALLISLTAGMIVTRVNTNASDAEANVGREMAEQVLSQPKAWLIASGAMVGFSLVPGMPSMAFLVLGVVAFGVGVTRKQFLKETQLKRTENTEQSLHEVVLSGEQDVRRFDPLRPYVLYIDQSMPKDNVESLSRLVRRTRNILVSKLGLTLPSLVVELKALGANAFEFHVNEVVRLQGKYLPDALIATCSFRELMIGLKTKRPELTLIKGPQDPLKMDADSSESTSPDSASGNATLVVEDESGWWLSDAYRRELDEVGIPVLEGKAQLSQRFERVFLQTGAQFIGIQEASALMRWLESEQPELAKELERVIPLSRFADVLQRLASERISLRGLRQIAEALIENGGQERDPAALAEQVRFALRHQICASFSKNMGIQAIFLSEPLQQEFRAAMKQMANGGYLALNPETTHRLIVAVADLISASVDPTSSQHASADPAPEGTPPALVVPGDIRRVIRRVIENDLFQLPVLSFTEITSDLRIYTLGEVGASPAQTRKEKTCVEQSASSYSECDSGDYAAA